MSARESVHLTDEQLDDYTDAVMGDVERASAEQHLALCDRCRRAVSDTRELLAWAARERATVTAPSELWPLVGASTIHLAAVRRRVIASMRGLLVIGAITLIAATAMITWRVARWTAAPRAAASPAQGGRHRSGSHPIVPIAPEPPTPPTPPTLPDPP
jgi:predicted anti-sigma-YlaC factor YlaD